jgi:hypothetical protein
VCGWLRTKKGMGGYRLEALLLATEYSGFESGHRPRKSEVGDKRALQSDCSPPKIFKNHLLLAINPNCLVLIVYGRTSGEFEGAQLLQSQASSSSTAAGPTGLNII